MPAVHQEEVARMLGMLVVPAVATERLRAAWYVTPDFALRHVNGQPFTTPIRGSATRRSPG